MRDKRAGPRTVQPFAGLVAWVFERPSLLFVNLVVLLAAGAGLAVVLNWCAHRYLAGVGILIVSLVVIALLATVNYANLALDYSERTQERLKGALRETRTDLDEEKTGQTPLRLKVIEEINASFDEEELRALCVWLNATYPTLLVDPPLDYDNLRGQGKAAKARELVGYFERRKMMAGLVAAVRSKRPLTTL